jgi:glycosyltransferase involved in cell wall biosynthesis
MRVVMLGQYPLDEQRILGGVEAVMVPLVRGLAGFDDLDLHIVTCQPRQEERTTHTAAGVPLHVLNRKRLGRVTWHRRDIQTMGRTLRQLAPDVVHAQGMGIYAAAAVAAPYPHVATAHGIFFREAGFATGLASRVRRWMDSNFERYCVTRVQNLVSISPYVEQELVQNRGFEGRVYDIENPVHAGFFDVTDPGDDVTILYAGRVIPRKGLLELLVALASVRKEIPTVQLHIAGETDSAPHYVAACRQFIEQEHLDSAVTFLGSLALEAMVAEHARCALLVLPSKQETAPVVVAEAMAAGRAVVATRICGVPFMVEDGVSGLLVEDGDTAGLASALLRLLRDPVLRSQMGQRGHQIAQTRFSGAVVARRTREVYMRLAGA